MGKALTILKGRGTALDPPNRFEPLVLTADADAGGEDCADPSAANLSVPTRFFRDRSRSILTRNDSPDVGFEYSVNPYRGCEHGCIYCYARPGHEYLGWSAGLDFESKIMVKLDAPRLLARELRSGHWQPTTIHFAGVTDVYQPVERRLRLTRGCLEVCEQFGNPVSVITKNALIVRDNDLLSRLARRNLCMAWISITTLDAGLSAKMEPRASAPRARLEAIRQLAGAGVPVGVMAAPIIPGLTDQEMPRILAAAAHAGACFAGYTVLRLPHPVEGLFRDWLDRHFPGRKERVLSRIRALRGGKLNDPHFHSRMRGTGPWADQFRALFEVACRRVGLDRQPRPLACDQFCRSAVPTLWD